MKSKKQMLVSTANPAKQGGFSILEALIGLVIFVIVVLGSGTMLSRSLSTLKDINVNTAVINFAQKNLQELHNSSDMPCEGSSSVTDTVANIEFTVYCTVEKTSVSIPNSSDKIEVAWPILTVCPVDTQPNSPECYKVGI